MSKAVLPYRRIRAQTIKILEIVVNMFNILREGIINIYYTQVSNIEPGFRAKLLDILSDEEEQTYNNYKIDHKRIEFLIGRYLLRSILAYYLNITPRDILFFRNDYGKLYLSDNFRFKTKEVIKFNLAHSCGIVVCAITLNNEVGVDVEQANGEIIEIAERFFSPGEIQYICGYQGNLKNEIAYRLWTLKEAYAKATGIGLSLELSSFNVLEIEEMFFDTIVPKPGYYLSVAVENIKRVAFQTKFEEINLSEIPLL
jgi:4'-phosphopantetheinyl transferase